MTLSQEQFEPAEGLQEVLDRQEAMLREVNHRAKNSIAMAIGLLRLQKQRSRALRVKQALDQAIQRLYHLARIHDILSRHGNGSDRIDMPTYLAELCDSFSPVIGNVEIRLRADAIELDASRVAPVALIVGEAVSNAIKHAYPDGKAGVVRVTLSCDATSVALAVEDDGIGCKNTSATGSLGVRLMTEMARSLGGELAMGSDSGTRVSTSFPLAGPKAIANFGAGVEMRRRGSPVREVAPPWRAAPARGFRD
jgi:two-component sensor histidine kinase